MPSVALQKVDEIRRRLAVPAGRRSSPFEPSVAVACSSTSARPPHPLRNQDGVGGCDPRLPRFPRVDQIDVPALQGRMGARVVHDRDEPVARRDQHVGGRQNFGHARRCCCCSGPQRRSLQVPRDTSDASQYTFPSDPVVLPLLGAIFSTIPFYMILAVPKQSSTGRFTLLTYNLTSLYAYNLRDLNVGWIAYHRTVAVVAGVAWAWLISSYVYPYQARRELRRGLSDFLHSTAYFYERLIQVVRSRSSSFVG